MAIQQQQQHEIQVPYQFAVVYTHLRTIDHLLRDAIRYDRSMEESLTPCLKAVREAQYELLARKYGHKNGGAE